MGGSCLAHKLVVKLVVFPMMMAGSKDLKCASEAMEQIKVHRARFQEALMWPPPQKRLRTVLRGSTYQGKLSSSILTTMLSAGIAALAHRKNEIACQDAKQIPQQIATYGPQNGSKIGPSKWVPCNQLIHLLCIWKLGMAHKTGSEKKTPKWGPDRTKTEANIWLLSQTLPSPRERGEVLAEAAFSWTCFSRRPLRLRKSVSCRQCMPGCVLGGLLYCTGCGSTWGSRIHVMD